MSSEVRMIQISHIIKEARLKQQMYSNHECTVDEIEGRTANEKLMILVKRTEELEASKALAYKEVEIQCRSVQKLNAQLERVREALAIYTDSEDVAYHVAKALDNDDEQ